MFPEKPQAINYAQSRATFRSGEIRILDSTGKLERMIAFTEAGRKLSMHIYPIPVASLLFATISNEGVSSISRVALKNLAHA